MGIIRFLSNVIWFVCAGIWLALGWAIVGALWCVTVVGIPVGVQCFKVARLALAPFGTQVDYGGGAGSFLLNVAWICLGGIELCGLAIVTGLVCCVTVVGIPAGIQAFKFAKLALMPFGSSVAFAR